MLENMATDHNACGEGHIFTGNVAPILNEIRHALQRLLDEEETTVIDLRGIPMGPGEEKHLESLLGTGEVTATIDAMGLSTVSETTLAGVWLVVHRNDNDDILGKFIEITRYPKILESQTEDIRSAVERLPGILADYS